jgi:hypothetical protein
MAEHLLFAVIGLLVGIGGGWLGHAKLAAKVSKLETDTTTFVNTVKKDAK